MKCAKCSGEMMKGLVMTKPFFGYYRPIGHLLIWGSNIKKSFIRGLTYQDEHDLETYKCKK